LSLACFVVVSLAPAFAGAAVPASFRIATYNLENYLEQPAGTRPAKSPEGKAAIRESLRRLHADVVALQEIGSTNALLELRTALERDGLTYPHWEHVTGSDTNIHVAVLSRFPIIARRPHTNDAFLLFGRRFRVSRGFAEVDIRVNDRYAFTLITAHLKSRRPVPEADEAELREQEAIVLRELVDTRLKANPRLNLVVMGDFNDTKDSRSTRALLGRSNSNTGLVDTRPAERNGDENTRADPRTATRQITWTHHYGKEDSYSRLDYILLSKGMAREWDRAETYVLAMSNWGVASDHRPVVAGFMAEDK
jgi:endonuclease/exonuclease/phosphatase family metal-dependent hydrolase